MIDSRRRLLLSEIDLQCGFALQAYSAASTAFQRLDPGGFWSNIHSLLAAAHRLQRLIAVHSQGQTVILLQEGSPLQDPKLDALTDLAAAFEAWIAAHPRGPWRLTNFGPHGVSAADPTVFARFFDADRSWVVIYGTAYDLPALLSSISTLQSAVAGQLKQLQAVV